MSCSYIPSGVCYNSRGGEAPTTEGVAYRERAGSVLSERELVEHESEELYELDQHQHDVYGVREHVLEGQQVGDLEHLVLQGDSPRPPLLVPEASTRQVVGDTSPTLVVFTFVQN